jgi:hypothetical protein
MIGVGSGCRAEVPHPALSPREVGKLQRAEDEYDRRCVMVAMLFMAMVVSVSALRMRALTANRAGGVARSAGGIPWTVDDVNRSNGAIGFSKQRENRYQTTYHRGRDPPLSLDDLGQRASTQRWFSVVSERSRELRERKVCFAGKPRGDNEDALVHDESGHRSKTGGSCSGYSQQGNGQEAFEQADFRLRTLPGTGRIEVLCADSQFDAILGQV